MGYLNNLIASIIDNLRVQRKSQFAPMLESIDTAIGIDIDRALKVDAVPNVVEPFISHRYTFAPDAVGVATVHAAIPLGAANQNIATAITQPDVPRTVTIKGNVAGITGNVVVTGANFDGDAITDTIALNGTTEVEGIKAFAQIGNILVPAQSHTPTKQKETATASGSVSGSGNAAVVVTAAGMTNSPKTFAVAVAASDTAAQWAAKVRSVLAADVDVSAFFDVSGADAAIVLEAKAAAANDTTMNVALDNGTCTGITTAASSANTTAGVGSDAVSVGTGKKFGMPEIVDSASFLQFKLFDGSTDSGSLTVHADLEKNLFALNGTPDGTKIVDLVYLV